MECVYKVTWLLYVNINRFPRKYLVDQFGGMREVDKGEWTRSLSE